MEVLSINPFWYNRERDLAGLIVRIQNESWLSSVPQSRSVCRFRFADAAGARSCGAGTRHRGKKQGLKGAAIGEFR
jgi:aminocarboxymuconate-semialdehyde decarboxylase